MRIRATDRSHPRAKENYRHKTEEKRKKNKIKQNRKTVADMFT